MDTGYKIKIAVRYCWSFQGWSSPRLHALRNEWRLSSTLISYHTWYSRTQMVVRRNHCQASSIRSQILERVVMTKWVSVHCKMPIKRTKDHNKLLLAGVIKATIQPTIQGVDYCWATLPTEPRPTKASWSRDMCGLILEYNARSFPVVNILVWIFCSFLKTFK